MSVFTRNLYLKLLASLLESLGVGRIDHIDENVRVLEIVPPVGPSQRTRYRNQISVHRFFRHRIQSLNFKLLRSPGIVSKESISPAYVAWRAGAITLFLLGSQPT
jgi:hypothetical protein